MKFLKCLIILTIFLSTTCSFSIVGKIVDKLSLVQDVKKDIKADKFNAISNALKNVSDGFIPSQIKCRC